MTQAAECTAERGLVERKAGRQDDRTAGTLAEGWWGLWMSAARELQRDPTR